MAYSIRAILVQTDKWVNAEIGTARTKKAAVVFAEQYAIEHGRACYVYRLTQISTAWAGPQ